MHFLNYIGIHQWLPHSWNLTLGYCWSAHLYILMFIDETFWNTYSYMISIHTLKIRGKSSCIFSISKTMDTGTRIIRKIVPTKMVWYVTLQEIVCFLLLFFCFVFFRGRVPFQPPERKKKQQQQKMPSASGDEEKNRENLWGKKTSEIHEKSLSSFPQVFKWTWIIFYRFNDCEHQYSAL